MLKILRSSKGLTQKDVSKYLNIKQYNISDWETGRSTPDINTLIKLADLYEVSLDDMCSHSFEGNKSTSTYAIDDYIKDLHTLKIIRRIDPLEPKEKDQLFNMIDSIIKTMFNK